MKAGEGLVENNGDTVEVITWQQNPDGGDKLSFSIANGKSRHRACHYSTSVTDGLLDRLKREFGTPDGIESSKFSEVVSWRKGAVEVAFSRVASSAVIADVDNYERAEP